MKKFVIAALAALGSLSVAAPANAIVIYLTGGAPTAEGSNFRYTYEGNFAEGEGVESGSRLVIFDFLGYVDNSITAGGLSNVTTSTNFTSGLPGIGGFTDDPGILNLEFTYTGPTIADLSNVSFGGFGAVSTLGILGREGFSALTIKSDGSLVGSQGSVLSPAGAIPEPATWAMMIIGLGFVGSVMRRRNAKVATATPRLA